MCADITSGGKIFPHSCCITLKGGSSCTVNGMFQVSFDGSSYSCNFGTTSTIDTVSLPVTQINTTSWNGGYLGGFVSSYNAFSEQETLNITLPSSDETVPFPELCSSNYGCCYAQTTSCSPSNLIFLSYGTNPNQIPIITRVINTGQDPMGYMSGQRIMANSKYSWTSWSLNLPSQGVLNFAINNVAIEQHSCDDKILQQLMN